MKYLILLALFAACAKAPVKTITAQECLSTRNRILSARSISPLTYDENECHVVKGMWEDYFYPQFQTQAEKLDVVYLVHPKHAKEVAPKNWSKENSDALSADPENLVVTDKSFSKKKGTKTIVKWLPAHKEYACKYIKAWTKIKNKYKLKITKAEKAKIKEMACH